MRIRHFIYRTVMACIAAVVIITLLPSCTGQGGGVNRVLDTADSLMAERPDSALTLLEAMLPDTSAMHSHTLMRYHLLRTNARNKCDTVLNATDLAHMRRVAACYDSIMYSIASPNVKDGSTVMGNDNNMYVLAHYLLGRCYFDLSEYSFALQEYHKASNIAESSLTSDFGTLCLVYAQEAELFYLQGMYTEQLRALDHVVECATILDDSLFVALALNSKAAAFDMMGIKDSALVIERSSYMMLKNLGCDNLAAQSSGFRNGVLLSMGRYDDVNFQEYETASGLFSKDGHVEKGRELYYIHKGEYFQGYGRLDSAEHYYRVCRERAATLDDRYSANRHLAELFRLRHKSDSVSKYAMLAVQENESIQLASNKRALESLQQLHEYTINETEVKSLMVQSQRQRLARQAWMAGFFILLATAVAFLLTIIRRLKTLKEDNSKRIHEISAKYAAAVMKYEDASSDLLLLREADEIRRQELHDLNLRLSDVESTNKSINTLIFEKERLLDAQATTIHHLKGQLEEYKRHVRDEEHAGLEYQLKNSDVCLRFHQLANSNPPKRASLSDWKKLRAHIAAVLPEFYTKLCVDHHIDGNRFDLCILCRLGFRTTDIANLMGTSKPTVTNARHRIYAEIFGRKDENGEFDAFLRSLS